MMSWYKLIGVGRHVGTAGLQKKEGEAEGNKGKGGGEAGGANTGESGLMRSKWIDYMSSMRIT